MNGEWRTIAVALRLDAGGYLRGVDDAAARTKRFGDEVDRTTRRTATQWRSFGKDVLGVTKDGAEGLRQASESMDRFGSKMTRGVTLPVGLAGAASVKMAMDFNTSFTQMQALAGVSAGEVDGLKESVKDLAGETARSPQELAEALYFVRSSGVDAADGVKVLDASARSAAIGMGTSGEVADVLTSALNAYGSENLSAADAADQLATAVESGKREAGELAPTLGRLLPVASSLGISFAEVSGSVAFFTTKGLPASQAATRLEGIMQKLVRPSTQAREELFKVGISADSIRQSIEEKGLLGTLQDMGDRLGVNSQAFAKVFDDSEAYSGALDLLAGNGEAAAKVLESVADQSVSVAEKFAELQGTDEFAARQAIADLQVAAIDLGQKLVPILADVADAVSGVVGVFSALPGPVQTGLIALAGVAALVGPISKLGSAGVGVVAWVTKLRDASDANGVGGLTDGVKGLGDAAGSTDGRLSRMIQAIGPEGVAAGVVGLSAITAALQYMQVEADRAQNNVSDLQRQIAAGTPPADAAALKLSNTLAGIDGGFEGLKGSSDAFRKKMEELGLSATDVTQLITGPQAAFDEKLKAIMATPGQNKHQLSEFATNLNLMREATSGAVDAERIRKEVEGELGIETDKGTAATKDNTAATTDNASAQQEAISALQAQVDARRELYSAQRDDAQASQDLLSALDELHQAEQEAAGNGPQSAAARKAVADAYQAQQDAIEGVQEARQNLTDAEAEARDGLEKLRLEIEKSALAGDQARQDLAEARQNEQDILNDPGATKAEKAQATLDRRAAELAVREADKARRDAEAEAAKGVAGNDQVISAKKALADALDNQRQAEGRVSEATAAAAQVQIDAKAKVSEAAKNVEDAVLKEADAHSKVAELAFGAAAGNDAYIQSLENSLAMLSPDSPYRSSLQGLIDDLKELRDLQSTTGTAPGGAAPASSQPGGGRTGTIGSYSNRWGGIYDHMAGGGIRKSMIGSGRNMVWWDEPATGKEAYFPMLGDLARNERHMAEVAGWYGGTYLPHDWKPIVSMPQQAPRIPLNAHRQGVTLAEVGALVAAAVGRPNVNIDARDTGVDADRLAQRIDTTSRFGGHP